MTTDSITQLSDRDVLSATARLAERERQTTAELIALLAELDARRLYLGEGCSSLFTYCTQVLRLSESATYARITAARTSRRFPCLLGVLAEGVVTLTTVGLIAPHLTEDNCESLLNSVRYASKRDVERLIAALHPQPNIPPTIRALRTQPRALADLPLVPPPSASADRSRDSTPVVRTGPARGSIVAPLAPRRYLLRLTIPEETQQKLERLHALLRHQIPGGDPAVIIDRSLTLLLAETERTKFAATKRKETSRSVVPTGRRSRRIPSAVRRAVWSRDQGRCAFEGLAGRCRENAFLEFHHVIPFATGGASTLENLELRCRAHNRYEAELAGLFRRPVERSMRSSNLET